jgi:alpha/beta superfamily hydrolase
MHEQSTHRSDEKDGMMEMIIDGLEVGAISNVGFYPISLKTSRGELECRYYAAAERRRAVIFLGGTVGGWDTPVRDMLYPGLCKDFARHGINSLRVKYRYSHNLSESILDVLAGVSFLLQDGVESVAIVGHSFGGAVAIQAAVASPFISTVIALSSQFMGTDVVGSFRDSQSLLLIHGTADEKYPFIDSSHIFDSAHDPKKIILYKGAHHDLDEAAPEVFRTVKDWIHKQT